MEEYIFSISLRIDDPEALRQAALEHEDAQPDQDFLDGDGEVDINACLVMLLDPSSLPGCEIHDSGAEAIDV